MKFVKTVILVYILCFAANAYSDEIHDAAKSGDLNAIKKLLGADSRLLNSSDSGGNTPLHSASEAGQLEVVRYLVETGADVNARNTSGDTPLHRAAFRGYVDVVKYLVEKGAVIDSKNNRNRTTPKILDKPVSTEIGEVCPIVSPDGKYLFFQRGGIRSGSVAK